MTAPFATDLLGWKSSRFVSGVAAARATDAPAFDSALLRTARLVGDAAAAVAVASAPASLRW